MHVPSKWRAVFYRKLHGIGNKWHRWKLEGIVRRRIASRSNWISARKRGLGPEGLRLKPYRARSKMPLRMSFSSLLPLSPASSFWSSSHDAHLNNIAQAEPIKLPCRRMIADPSQSTPCWCQMGLVQSVEYRSCRRARHSHRYVQFWNQTTLWRRCNHIFKTFTSGLKRFVSKRYFPFRGAGA